MSEAFLRKSARETDWPRRIFNQKLGNLRG
nr:MAG TPA: hypothetical protein [Caudoviricetes sp.]